MFDRETMKLVKLRRVTREFVKRRELLHDIWKKMQVFTQGLRNELDDNYWSENLIAFKDIEIVPEHNPYRFQFSELERLFNISFVREVLMSYRKLSQEKAQLEAELGISMDKAYGY